MRFQMIATVEDGMANYRTAVGAYKLLLKKVSAEYQPYIPLLAMRQVDYEAVSKEREKLAMAQFVLSLSPFEADMIHKEMGLDDSLSRLI